MVDYKGKCWDKIKMKNETNETKTNNVNQKINKQKVKIKKKPNQVKMVDSSRPRLRLDGGFR